MATLTHSAGVADIMFDNSSGTPVDFAPYMPGVALETSVETADSTAVADAARKFVFGLEDGGETTVDVMLDASDVAWDHLIAVFNARYVGTLSVYPLGNTSGKPSISREVGITGLGTPVVIDDVAKVSVTFKAHGATTLGSV